MLLHNEAIRNDFVLTHWALSLPLFRVDLPISNPAHHFYFFFKKKKKIDLRKSYMKILATFNIKEREVFDPIKEKWVDSPIIDSKQIKIVLKYL